MAKYKKKPVVVEAVQWKGNNIKEIKQFVDNDKLAEPAEFCEVKNLIIKTLEGDMIAPIGDYIIKGVNGEYYPCKPNIFEKTYEKVEE